MNKRKYLKQLINENYFELESSKFAQYFTCKKYNFTKKNLPQSEKSALYLFNKTTKDDKNFVTHIIKTDFVFLKDDVVQKLYSKTISKNEINDIFKIIKNLKAENISIAMFPEKDITIFGDSSPLPPVVTDFISKTTLDIKIVSFCGTYFSNAVWSKYFNKCECSFNHIYSIPAENLKNKSSLEINLELNKHIPSSATVYASKYPLNLNSNRLAEGLEQVVYVCPNCNNFFSIYSEFNCLKCSNCSTAIEFDKDGKILLSKIVHSLDDLKVYQFNVLKQIVYTNDYIKSYDNIIINNKQKSKSNLVKASLEIYATKFVLIEKETPESPEKKETYKFEKIKSFSYGYKNTLTFFDENNKKITIQGENRENFYILLDLYKIVTNKS